MTVQEAVGLVIQAGAIGSNNEVLVLDMGEPVRIADMALLLRDYPPPRHTEDVQTLYDKTTVLPIGIAAPAVSNQHLEQVPLVLWNHRWEHDKGLELFSTAMCDLARSGASFRLAVCGEKPIDGMPRHFERLRAELEERIVHFGFAAGADYERLLGAADIVVSTATHDFFGVAIVEAMAATTCPILPRRLAYPELLPEALHDRCLYSSDEYLGGALRWVLDHPTERAEFAAQAALATKRFAWEEVAATYDRAFAPLAV